MKKLLFALFLVLCAQTMACQKEDPPFDVTYVDVDLSLALFGCVSEGSDLSAGTKMTVTVDAKHPNDHTQTIDTKTYDFVKGQNKNSQLMWAIQVPDNTVFEIKFSATSPACQSCSDCVFLCQNGASYTNRGSETFNQAIEKGEQLFVFFDIFKDSDCTCQAANSCRIGTDGTGGSHQGTGGSTATGGSDGAGLGGETSTNGNDGSGSGGSGGGSGRGPNLALEASVSAETTFSGYSAARMNDGDRSTELGGESSWTNAWDVYDLPQYVIFQFEGEETVSEVDVYTTASLPIKEFDVAYRSGMVWTVVAEVRGNTAPLVNVTFPAASTDQLAIVPRRGSDAQFNFARLNEVEIY